MERVRAGGIDIEEAIEKLRHMPYEDLGFAHVDHHRQIRRGFPEVIYCPGKTTEQIVENSGGQGDVVVAQLLEKLRKETNVGYNANTGEFVDMFKAGIIDPAKVARTALEMAASVAGLMLTTNVLVTELKDKDKDEEPIPGSIR